MASKIVVICEQGDNWTNYKVIGAKNTTEFHMGIFLDKTEIEFMISKGIEVLIKPVKTYLGE